MICIEKVKKRNNIIMNLKEMGKTISPASDIKYFPTAFLHAIAALFQHCDFLHLI